MTVGELIESLRKADPTTSVRIFTEQDREEAESVEVEDTIATSAGFYLLTERDFDDETSKDGQDGTNPTTNT